MGFEPHSVPGRPKRPPAPTEGASPLVCSPRKGLTPFENPLSWVSNPCRKRFVEVSLERAMGFEPTTTSLGS